MKASMLRTEEYYRNKQEQALEQQHVELQRATMDESSKHYATKIKLENAEMAKSDVECALKKEKEAHERTKQEMYSEIISLKRELAKQKKVGVNRKKRKSCAV